MSPSAVLVVTWLSAAVVVGLYVWLMVWRVRVDRRKKAAAAETATRMSSAIDRAAQLATELAAEPKDERRPVDAPVVPPVDAPTPAVTPDPVVSPVAAEATVAGALAGIALPHDLVPLTTMVDRPGVADRVAFWTNTAPADLVGTAFIAELERLGYSVSTVDEQSISARRDGQWVRAEIHPDGRAATIADKPAFESVPEHAVVIEVWLPE